MDETAAFPRIFPFAISIAFLVLSDLAASLFGLSTNQLLWLYPCKTVVIALILVFYWKSYKEFCISFRNQDLIYALIAGLIVFLIWILPYPEWLGGKVNIAPMPIASENSALQVIFLFFRLFGSAIAIPILEELFWRSFLMRWLTNRKFSSVKPEYVTTFAYLSTALLFAIEHHLWLAGLIAGLVYGELYKNYRSLWIPTIAHITTNYMLGCWVLITKQWQYW